MAVGLPDGTFLSRGEPFADLLYDPSAYDNLRVEVSFGNEKLRVERSFLLTPEGIEITDTVRAPSRVSVDRAVSRLPIITINPENRVPEMEGLSSGKRVQILPPFYMRAGELCNADQTIIKGLHRLDTLRVSYGDYGFVFNQKSPGGIRLGITGFEWLENRRMRVAGKTLDLIWVFEPVRLEPGETREFRYEIMPFSGGSGAGRSDAR
ncbi:MAG: hypothetical protein HYY08_03740 [Firmicutes bacterium]|nr:hypothetical protein [Bacillota bacterium]